MDRYKDFIRAIWKCGPSSANWYPSLYADCCMEHRWIIFALLKCINIRMLNGVFRDWYDPKTDGKEKLGRFLSDNDRFLIKPVLSSQGKGIELLYSKDVDRDSFFVDIKEKKVMLEGFIHQHDTMVQINSSSVNTVGLITARCGKKVHILHGGGLRCGGKDSFVDNFHNGGCTYPIDIKTGIIDGPGVSLGSKKKMIKHPSSDVVKYGFQIPNWNKVLDTVKAAALVMERVGHIGWDIEVLENGVEIIEVNINYPGTNIVQLDGFSVFDHIKAFLEQCESKIES